MISVLLICWVYINKKPGGQLLVHPKVQRRAMNIYTMDHRYFVIAVLWACACSSGRKLRQWHLRRSCGTVCLQFRLGRLKLRWALSRVSALWRGREGSMRRICARRSCCYRGKERVGVQRAAAEIYGKTLGTEMAPFLCGFRRHCVCDDGFGGDDCGQSHCPKCLNGGTCVEGRDSAWTERLAAKFSWGHILAKLRNTAYGFYWCDIPWIIVSSRLLGWGRPCRCLKAAQPANAHQNSSLPGRSWPYRIRDMFTVLSLLS